MFLALAELPPDKEEISGGIAIGTRGGLEDDADILEKRWFGWIRAERMTHLDCV